MTIDGFTKARTVARLADELARALDACGIAEPVSESREIVAALYDVPRFWSLANGHVEVDDATRARASLAVERLKTYIGQPKLMAPLRREAQLLLPDVGNCFASGAHHVVMCFIIYLHAERAVMHAHLAENAAFDK